MFQSREQRKLAVIGMVIIVYALVAMLNNLVLNESADAWATLLGSLAAAVMFGVVYWVDREGWAAIGTYVTGAIAIFLLLIVLNILTGNGIPTMVMALIALPFIVGWYFNREQWGLLVPAYVLLAIIPIFYLGDNEGVGVPSYVMLAIALPFLAGWLANRENYGLLIPAYVMLAIIPILLLGEGENDDSYLVPAYVMFAIGLPFFVTWVMDRRKWGFLIPAVILFVMAVGFLGLNAGMPETLLSIGMPVLGLLAGGALLVWAYTYQNEKQKQI